jgi:septum formation protein
MPSSSPPTPWSRLGRRILPKAETEAQARACLSRLMSGRRHRVLTAAWRVRRAGRQRAASAW